MGRATIGTAIVLGLIAAGTANAAPASRGAFAFTGAHLGMTLRDWREMPFPGRPAPGVEPICTGDPGADRDAAISPTAAERHVGAIVCGYGERLGDFVLAQGIRPAAGRRPAMVRLVFLGGRLSRIRYTTSRDVFDKVTYRLKGIYGPPQAIMRDQVQTGMGKLERVRMSWTTSSGSTVLIDPADARLDLAVELSAPSH